MTTWIHSSLSEAVDTLQKVGMVDLASDMRRLLESSEVENLKIFRKAAFEDLANAVAEVDDSVEFVALLRQIAKAFGLAHATVHSLNETDAMAFDPRVITTYPSSWIKRYVEKGYAGIDPVIATASAATEGFFWDSIRQDVPVIEAFFADARAFRVGASGYTLPAEVWNGARVALTVTSTLSPRAFRELFEPMRSDFDALAYEVICAFGEIAAQEYRPEKTPPENLLRLLRGLARGKTLQELADLNLIDDVVDASRQICAFYEARTLLQAVIICTRLNHLDGLPFDHSEIAADRSEDEEPIDPHDYAAQVGLR